MTIGKVNLVEKFKLFNETWSPQIVAELNDNYILLAKLQGEFVWHTHQDEDELFLVVEGNLVIKLRDREVKLSTGEFFIVPKGVEHFPVAEKEALVMLIEPSTTKHTGEVVTERTVTDYKRI